MRPELLVPAGDLEKLKFAVRYGADSVYCGGKEYGLRAKAGNLTLKEMAMGVKFAHQNGVRVYTTVNIIPRNEDLSRLGKYLIHLADCGVDGLIISDPGIMALAQKKVPGLELHLSTQANTTSWRAARYWQKAGIKRIILARELSLKEIAGIADRVEAELEVFVHGAMCISYSGRCLLSNYLADRDANRGECAQPCRWRYQLLEEKRPGEYLPLFEDDRGSYIFNSRDVCLIEHLPELIAAGVDACKIEGRMKGIHYVATTTRVYRMALDHYAEDPDGFEFNPEWREELTKVSHRDYTTGFLFGSPGGEGQRFSTSQYIRTHDFVGVVRDFDQEENLVTVEVRNKLYSGDEVEIFGPDSGPFTDVVRKLRDKESGVRIHDAPHPHQLVTFRTRHPVEPYSLVRRKREDQV